MKRIAALVLTTGLVLPLFALTPAQAATTAPAGLFGIQDPTYDGVYRQSEAILAYSALDKPVPESAIGWLKDQQCADGGWQAFRADTTKACDPADPVTYSGEDSNSTALAVAALATVGETGAVDQGLAYLRSIQLSNGALPYFKGGDADASSSALAAAAITTAGQSINSFANGGASLREGLNQFQIGCDGASAQQGGFRFLTSDELFANDFASVQALLGISNSAVPVAPSSIDNAEQAFTCPTSDPISNTDRVSAAAAHVVSRLEAGSGTIESAYTPGTVDWTNTRFAVLSLAASGHGRDAIAIALNALASSVAETTVDAGGNDKPGTLAELILANEAGKSALQPLATSTGLDSQALFERLEATLTSGGEDYSGTPETVQDGRTAVQKKTLADSGPSPSIQANARIAVLLVLAGCALLVLSRRRATA